MRYSRYLGTAIELGSAALTYYLIKHFEWDKAVADWLLTFDKYPKNPAVSS